MSAQARAPARRRAWACLALLLAVSVAGGAGLASGAPGASAAAPGASRASHVRARTSLPVIERQVMCVTCKIPLNVAQSPQADRERAFIQSLIDRGEGEAEIKSALVAQYGATVLGLPATHGFDLTAYLVPLAVVLGLVALVAALLPRWRRQSRAQVTEDPPAQALSASDSARLESDLARFD